MSTQPRVGIVYKNFGGNIDTSVDIELGSTIGLGLAALHNSKSLLAAGIHTEVWPALSADDVAARLAADPSFTHVAVFAPWIPSIQLHQMTVAYPHTNFVLVSHSNVGFLHADSFGVTLLRDAMDIQAERPNFSLAGNSQRFASGSRPRTACPAPACQICTLCPHSL